MKTWNVKDIDFLVSNYENMPNSEISQTLNKSLSSINNKAQELKLFKSKSYVSKINTSRVSDKWGESLWKKEEINYLISNINNMTNFEISNSLNKSKDSIVSMCGRLGLKRIKKYNKDYIESECLKYITKSELRISDPNLYNWLYHNGKMADVSKHMMNISYSTPQLILKYFISNLISLKFNYNDRTAIKPYEIDIYFPSHKFGIEYDGSYRHPNGNSFKVNLCKRNNIKLLTINEVNLSKKNFNEYVRNIKDQLLENLSFINNNLKSKITSIEVSNMEIGKSEIFKGLFDVSKIRDICDKYNDYSIFIREQRSAYNKLYYLGLLKDYTSHMKINPPSRTNEMKYLIERKSYYNIGDKILIEYWYNDMITVVAIVSKEGRSYKVTHNISQSKIKNAPDETIKSSDILDRYHTSDSSGN